MQSVLEEWVMKLPLMQQSVLCSALRGPDGFPKNCDAKYLLRYLRGVILVPARPEFIAEGRDDVFMIKQDRYYNTRGPSVRVHKAGEVFMSPFMQACGAYLSDLDPYPLHFITHLAHAAEIVGYRMPIFPDEEDRLGQTIRWQWNWFYAETCRALHMKPEQLDELDERLKY